MGTAIRSGGHSVAGRSAAEEIVLDVTPMGSVAVAGEVATVGVGVRLGNLDALATHGLTIPAGCGPSVGIAGLTLGGGLGILGRKHGLAATTCSGRKSSWPTVASSTATSTTTRSCSGRAAWRRPIRRGHLPHLPHPPAPAATVFQLTWPPAAAAAVVQAWQAWAPEGLTSWTALCG